MKIKSPNDSVLSSIESQPINPIQNQCKSDSSNGSQKQRERVAAAAYLLGCVSMAGLPDVVVLLDVNLMKHHVFLLGIYVGFHLHGNVSRKHWEQEPLLWESDRTLRSAAPSRPQDECLGGEAAPASATRQQQSRFLKIRIHWSPVLTLATGNFL